MTTAIVYYSKHHGNTKKVLDAISENDPVTLIDITKAQNIDFTGYDLIGIASGIYYGKFHSSILQFVKNNLPCGKSVFFLFTCGAKKESYLNSIKTIATQKSLKIIGSFGCLGLDTFGPFQLIGGIAKGHPNQTDFDMAIQFYRTILSKQY